MAFAACYIAFIGGSWCQHVHSDFTFFSLDLGIPGGPGRHGWSTDLSVFTVSLDFWNRFSAQFGIGIMDNSLDLWSW